VELDIAKTITMGTMTKQIAYKTKQTKVFLQAFFLGAQFTQVSL
jgi:hypothetical protein